MAQYTAIFTKPYEDGYENLPSQNTPITAETLNDKDDAIVNIETYLSENDIPSDAEGLSYDNTDSGLTADNLQSAVDELANEKVDKTGVDVKTDATGQFNTITGGLMQSCDIELDPIQNLHGYSKPWVGGSGKNLFPMTVDTIKTALGETGWTNNAKTISGVVFTILTDDGNNVTGIKLNGTASAGIIANLGSIILSGTYRLLGCPANGNASTYRLDLRDENAGNVYGTDVGLGVTISVSSYRRTIVIRIENGYTCNNLIFKPMVTSDLTVTYADFEPYSNICPISGHTQVQVGNCGKNKCDPNNMGHGVRDNSTGAITSTSNTASSTTNPIKVKSNTHYVITYDGTTQSTRVFYYDKNGSFISTEVSNSFTTPNNAEYVAFQSGGASGALDKWQLEEGSQATEYTPYNGYTTTINLGGTYYGGTLDAVSGVLTVTGKFKEFNGTEAWNASGTNGFAITRTNAGIEDVLVAGTKQTPMDSNMFPNGSTINVWTDGYIGIDNGTIWIGDTNLAQFTDLATFKTFLSNNHLQIVYPLATPFTIQLTPTQLETLVGQNDVFAPLQRQSLDSLTYREMLAWDDVERAVAVKLDLSSVAPIEYTDKASQSYNQKQLFIKDNKLCQALASISSGASFTENTNFKYTTLAEIIEPLIP